MKCAVHNTRLNHVHAYSNLAGRCCRVPAGKRCHRLKAEPDGKPDGSLESMFAKELAKRGIAESASSIDEDTAKASEQQSAPPPKDPFSTGSSGTADPFASSGSSSTRTRARAPPPPKAEASAGGQREKSMELVNEGLEGLIPRASVLLRLGGSFFLGFLPFILVISVLFGGIYMVFGDNFVHGGRPGAGLPTYVDPEKLLSEATVDPYIPY